MDNDAKLKGALDNIDGLSEEQVKFVLKISIIAGHFPIYWLEKSVDLAKVIKQND